MNSRNLLTSSKSPGATSLMARARVKSPLANSHLERRLREVWWSNSLSGI
ncbi:MAG: hypothetical protein WC173_07030 [Bacteroidales bacterium]